MLLALPLRPAGALAMMAFMFGVWKKPNPNPQIAIRQTMLAMPGSTGSTGQQRHTQPEDRQSKPTENARGIAIGETAGDRRHDRHHQRPRRHEKKTGLHLRPLQHILEVER